MYSVRPKSGKRQMSAQMKRQSLSERAHQYRVMAQRLEFHLARDTLPHAAASSVAEARQAVVTAAELIEEAALGPTCIRRLKDDKNLSD
jgi:hypothetical protein